MARFIAEISSNHNGDLARCLELIRSASACGCWAVKFQLFRIAELFAPEVLQASETHRLRRRWELPLHFLPELAACARSEGLAFGCTPFHLGAVGDLLPHVDFFKIASYELPWSDLVRTCAATGLPLMMSTGMANEREIKQAVRTARDAGCTDLTLFHCVSNYPVDAAHCQLAATHSLRRLLAEEFPGAKVGWSDHSVDAAVVCRATEHWQSEAVEFHFDLEGQGEEFSGGHCWLPADITPLIAGNIFDMTVAEAEACDGASQLGPTESELEERSWRADPDDGLRPIKEVRQPWLAERCGDDSGPRIALAAGGPGLGHVARLLALAESLRDRYQAQVVFHIPDISGARELLARNGFVWDQVLVQPGKVSDAQAIIKGQPRLCVLDLKEPCAELVQSLQAAGVAVMVLDRIDCPEADGVLLPSFGGNEELGCSGGPQYLLIRSDVTRLRPAETELAGEKITVSFGGEDPFLLTEKTVRALAALDSPPPVDIVIGPGFRQHRDQWPSPELNRPGFRIIDTGDPLETILPVSGLLITALGVSIAESMNMGVPVAVVTNYETDEEQAGYLADSGAATILGYHAHLSDGDLSQSLAFLWNDTARRQQMARAGLEFVDGQGARRSADLIAELLALPDPGEEGPC